MTGSAYWNPLPEARLIVNDPAEPRFRAGPSGELDVGFGKWEDRNWLNVPGPFYGAATFTCLAGPMVAPRNVLTDEDGLEFVYRQPRSRTEIVAVLEAAGSEPFGGYACDGDQHWTPEGVRAWWAGRGCVREWAQNLAVEYEASTHELAQREIPALRDYVSYIDGDLQHHLRDYVIWLSGGRESGPLAI